MFLLAFLLSVSAHASASSIVLNCTSYSHEYDMQIEVRANGATINVLRSDTKGPLALPLGKIELEPRQEETTQWVGWEGYSSRHNHVTFRSLRSDLNRSDEIAPNLSVSPDWTDTYDVEHGLRCKRQ
jgi:hypothetical protein